MVYAPLFGGYVIGSYAVNGLLPLKYLMANLKHAVSISCLIFNKQKKFRISNMVNISRVDFENLNLGNYSHLYQQPTLPYLSLV